jgi:phosphoglycerate dehydrogenase-like enzyme
MLMFVKNMSLFAAQKKEKKWERHIPVNLRGQTAGIIGLGHIGKEVARLAKCLGMQVIATSRSAGEGDKARYVDKLVPREKLPELLRESDFVILTLPSTAETTRLIGEKELRLMKPTSVIINIGRGNIIDEAALIRALEEKRIAGAGLDVFTQEPLPAESKLWALPNVILTPHIAGAMPDYSVHTTEIFCDNLARFLAGKKLKNIVDKKIGY